MPLKYVPKVGEPYYVDKNGNPQPYTAWCEVRDSLPWFLILAGASAVIIGLTIWLGWIIPVLVSAYLLCGVVWFLLDVGTAPSTMTEKRQWHTDRLSMSRGEVVGFIICVLPIWPMWASGRVVI